MSARLDQISNIQYRSATAIRLVSRSPQSRHLAGNVGSQNIVAPKQFADQLPVHCTTCCPTIHCCICRHSYEQHALERLYECSYQSFASGPVLPPRAQVLSDIFLLAPASAALKLWPVYAPRSVADGRQSCTSQSIFSLKAAC